MNNRITLCCYYAQLSAVLFEQLRQLLTMSCVISSFVQSYKAQGQRSLDRTFVHRTFVYSILLFAGQACIDCIKSSSFSDCYILFNLMHPEHRNFGVGM